MSRHRRDRPAPRAPGDTRGRVERASSEGRFKQALELAKQLHRQQPTPDHLELLKRTYLGRGRELRAAGYTRDSVNVFEVAAAVDPTNTAWLEQLAVEIAASGGAAQALALLARIPGSSAAPRIQSLAADAAVQQGESGKASLPPDLHADFDRVVAAFRQVEAGQDEAARETMQAIGLKSPFAEWKLMLRGLQAYHAGDDARAVENWQRLTADRLPARLAAPYRFQIDRAFRAAQPADTQARLQSQIDRLQPSRAVGQLRQLQAQLARDEPPATVFRQVEGVLAALKQDAPQLVGRLASCMYAAILRTGPDDLPRYRRLFGAPADDPNFHRLQAVAYERGASFTEAHRYWQLYEKEIADHPERWPAGQADRARALVWLHMGRNAALIPTGPERRRLPSFLRDVDELPRPLKPPADACFKKSQELAPDLLDAYEEPFRHYLHRDQAAKADQAARRLLKKFPDHVPTLEAYARLQRSRSKPAEALALFQRALAGNPLDRQLRTEVQYTHLVLARSLADAKQFDKARREYEVGLRLAESDHEAAYTLCRWATCELKAGDMTRADELLARARSRLPDTRLTEHMMAVEAGRLKLNKPIRTRHEDALKEALAGPVDPAAAVALADLTARIPPGYTGQKAIDKLVFAYVDRLQTGQTLTEAQAEQLCEALLHLKQKRRFSRFNDAARHRFPSNPFFPYFEGMLGCIDKQPRDVNVWQVRSVFELAQRLAQAVPPSDRREAMLEEIRGRLRVLEASNPFAFPFFADALDNLFGDEGDEDDEDDLDDEFW